MSVRDVLFSFDYPPLDGGVARLCAEIVTGLAKSGSVTVISQQRDEVGANIPHGAGVTDLRVSGRRPLREFKAWWRLLRHHRHDTVIVGTWYPEGLLATLAGCRNVVVLAHGAELMPPLQPWRRRLWRSIQSFVLSRATRVTANSHFTADLVRSCTPDANVVAIPLAVDEYRFMPGDSADARSRLNLQDVGDVVISTVTRIQDYKGIDTVLQAIALLPPEDRDRLTYLVAGRGAALESLQLLARVLGIESSVRWLGFVPEDDLPYVYRASDLFVLCTRDAPEVRSVEGFGLVFLEAQASGIPAIGTRTGGIPDAIVEGDGGWLIEQDDINALASHLTRLIHHPDVYTTEGLAARQRVERECTWNHYIERFREKIDSPL